MRNGFLISVASLVFATGIVAAQDEPLPQKQPDAKAPPLIELPQKQAGDQPPEKMPAPKSDFDLTPMPGLPGDGGCFGCCDAADCGCGSRCWGSLEYLLWWIKDGPVPGPLVTTDTSATHATLAGSLGQPGTAVLFGNSNLDYGRFSGMRLTVGGWITPCQTFGLEASAFFLEQRSVRFGAASDASGNPPLYIPALFNNGTKVIEDRLMIAQPLTNGVTNVGSVFWASSTQLWGAELNGVFCGWSSCCWEGSFLAGFRYAGLNESLSLNATNTNTVVTTAEVAPGPIVTTVADRFQTRNNFYGGQIGAKVSYRWEFLSVELIGKLALGDTHETVSVNGVSSLSGSGAPFQGTFPGGFFAQPSNIGNRDHDQFGVIPELEIKVGCDILPGLRAFIGYDIMYWNQVARPGSQIDRNLNLTQSAVISQTNPAVLQGAAFPQPLFNKSDFYANGVTFGLELRY